MAEGLNRWQGLGNLAADAELKDVGGEPVCNFRVACSRSYLDRNKERKESTQYVPCVIWGKRASALAQYLTKGARVYVEGEFQTRQYEKGGEKRYATDIRVGEIILCGGKRDGGRSAEPQLGGEPEPAGGDSYDDGDIPF